MDKPENQQKKPDDSGWWILIGAIGSALAYGILSLCIATMFHRTDVDSPYLNAENRLGIMFDSLVTIALGAILGGIGGKVATSGRINIAPRLRAACGGLLTGTLVSILVNGSLLPR